MPRVSVLMPVFNTAAYLHQALMSVREQQFAELELIVVNDGSTDKCSEILKTFAQDEPRMRLIERSNRGLIATRNELLNESRGEFVAWMDSDDLCRPDRLQQQVATFDANPALVCVGTNIQVVDPKGRDLGVEIYAQTDEAIRPEQMRGGGFRFASTMQRRSTAVAAGGFREPFRIGEDLDFLLRVADQGRLANLSDVLYVYRQHLRSTCTAMGLNWPEYSAVILELANERRVRGSDRLQRGEEILLPTLNSSEARRFMPVVLLNWAKGALSTGDRIRAVRYTLMSLVKSPFQKAGWRTLAKLLLQL